MDELHLKYRPDAWDEVVGHDNVVDSLEQVIERRGSRSFMFSGPAGVGKTTLARIIAKEVDCNKKDLVEIDAATHTGVDAMRDITQKLQYNPLHGPSKMIIVDECHRLSKNAWDALLKDVEEPPEGVYWAFCTTEPSKVPDTIQSRCLDYDLQPIDSDPLYELLIDVAEAEGSDVPDEVLWLIAERCDGSPRRALTWLAKCRNAESRKEASDILGAAAEEGEIIDFCRALLNPGSLTWSKAMRLLDKIDHNNPESVRITITRYFGKVARDPDPDKALYALHVLDLFSVPCPKSEGWAPFLLSLGDLVFEE